jgi:hypothetical protein
MRRSLQALKRGATLVVVMMAVVSCGDLLKKKGQDAGATATPTDPVNGTPVPAQPVLALNQGDITRYPDETAMPTPTKLAFQRGFNIRESVPNGKVIAGLGKGAVATQIAKRHPYVLITFDAPSSPGVTMMGWVHQDAFSLVVADAGALTCAAGETALFSDVPTCGKVCTSNTDCAANFACTGTSNKLAAGNKPGDPVKVCVQAPPTPPAAVDAGKPPPAAVDAGPPPAAVDAGNKSATPDPPAGTDEVNALPGHTCPGSFLYATKTGHCHRPCKDAHGNNQCDPKHFCSSCDGKQMCTNTRGVCKS